MSGVHCCLLTGPAGLQWSLRGLIAEREHDQARNLPGALPVTPDQEHRKRGGRNETQVVSSFRAPRGQRSNGKKRAPTAWRMRDRTPMVAAALSSRALSCRALSCRWSCELPLLTASTATHHVTPALMHTQQAGPQASSKRAAKSVHTSKRAAKSMLTMSMAPLRQTCC